MLDPLLEGIDVVFHQAGQPGVRLSWADGFPLYVSRTILATQSLLEASRCHALRRFVFASSSSVYGNSLSYPSDETALPRPESPYGVTKLAAEHLCTLYAQNWHVPTISLRYFTVYGPRQRPDMAINQFMAAAIRGQPVTVFGDGQQVRDFTYVQDVVAANIAAATADIEEGTVVNIAGGRPITVNSLLAMLEAVAGRLIVRQFEIPKKGDVSRTEGSAVRAADLLKWTPHVTMMDGLTAQWLWQSNAGRKEAGPD
jgi:UDP-glucuronate 4-epimerase